MSYTDERPWYLYYYYIKCRESQRDIQWVLPWFDSFSHTSWTPGRTTLFLYSGETFESSQDFYTSTLSHTPIHTHTRARAAIQISLCVYKYRRILYHPFGKLYYSLLDEKCEEFLERHDKSCLFFSYLFPVHIYEILSLELLYLISRKRGQALYRVYFINERQVVGFYLLFLRLEG